MKAFGTLLLLAGLTILGALVFVSMPANIPSLSRVDHEAGAWFGMTLALIGAGFLVGGNLSSMLEDTLRSIISIVSELRGIENRLDPIRGGARRSVQEFTSKDFSEHKCYELYYINGRYYIRGVNANFFTKTTSERRIDKTDLMRKNLPVFNFWTLENLPNNFLGLLRLTIVRLNDKKDTYALRSSRGVTPRLWRS